MKPPYRRSVTTVWGWIHRSWLSESGRMHRASLSTTFVKFYWV